MSNHISQLRRQIEELNCHMNIRRAMVSDASQQLMQFVVENEQRDYLIVKPPDNPFKPKSNCLFLQQNHTLQQLCLILETLSCLGFAKFTLVNPNCSIYCARCVDSIYSASIPGVVLVFCKFLDHVFLCWFILCTFFLC